MDSDSDSIELCRVNNMAWGFMKVDGLSFDVAIRLAADIIAHSEVSACEYPREDVQKIWQKLKSADSNC